MTGTEYIQAPNHCPAWVQLFHFPQPPGSPFPTSPSSHSTPAGLHVCWAHRSAPIGKAPPHASVEPCHPSEPCRDVLTPAEGPTITPPVRASAPSSKHLCVVWKVFISTLILLDCVYLLPALFPLPLAQCPVHCMCQINVSTVQLAQLHTHPIPSPRPYLEYGEIVNLPGACRGPAAVQNALVGHVIKCFQQPMGWALLLFPFYRGGNQGSLSLGKAEPCKSAGWGLREAPSSSECLKLTQMSCPQWPLWSLPSQKCLFFLWSPL